MTANTQDMNMQAPNNDLQNGEPNTKKSGIGRFFSYVFLPGVVPQVKELGRGGFGYLALLIATVYQAVRILPANHPYTKYENLGTFGIRQVIAAAANNVKVNKQNIDQVLIFFAVLVGIFILALQFISFVILMLSGDAWAQSAPQAGMFTTANPDTDVAFHMMREVFGVPKMFGDITPTSFHKALHVMFNFYNLALLLVAVLVFLYYVIVVVGETAQTGTPFGQRFSHIYAPFRLVIAIGLLVPLNYGLNGAQYITLYAAKIGSSFATTGWIQFNDSLAATNPLGVENATLIAETKSPDFRALTEFMALVNTCREAYGILPEGKKRTITQKCSVTQADGKEILSDCSGATSVSSTNDIKVIFGAYEDTSDFARYMPYCGTVVVPINVPVQQSTENGNPGELQKKYMEVVTSLWDNGDLKKMGKYFACVYNPYYNGAAYGENGTCPDEPAQDKRQKVYLEVKKQLDILVKQHYDDARSKADFKMRDQTKKLGWGGAGIWYNRIAQINGAYVTATINLPFGKTWPQAMEDVLKWKRDADGSLFGCKLFEPNLANNSPPAYKDGDMGAYLAGSFNAAFQFWTCDKKNTSNVFIDAASLIFGLNGLMSIRDKAKDSKGNDVQVHPLAKLSALGKGLVDAAIRNLVVAIGLAAGGGFAAGIGELQNLGAAGKAGASAIVSVATVGLS
ncbi:MAG TPA: DotA/TraY family protein, partial [Alphaproteobacteria bacterium]|nr:DotA/TraY family protein [Alphaproteobacteria bacterium]